MKAALFLGSAALLAGALAGMVPSSWWWFDLAASLRMQTLLGALALLVVSLVVRAKLALVPIAISLVLTVPSVSALIVADRPGSPASGSRLTVGHLNQQAGVVDLERVASEARRRDADVFVFVDFPAADRSGLPTHLAGYEVVLPTRARSVVVLTRLPVIAAIDPYEQALPGASVSFVVELADGTHVSLLALHTESPTRAASAATRNEQLQAVGTWAAGREGPVAVFGDLNVTPWAVEYRRLLDRSGLRSSLRGFGLQPSWPVRAGPLGITIDHLLHSPDLVTVDRATGPSFGSDHRSLWVTLAPAG